MKNFFKRYWQYMLGASIIITLITLVATTSCFAMSAFKHEDEKRNSFKYVITIGRHVYYSNEYEFTNGIMTIVDGYNGNTVCFFHQSVAVRQQH